MPTTSAATTCRGDFFLKLRSSRSRWLERSTSRRADGFPQGPGPAAASIGSFSSVTDTRKKYRRQMSLANRSVFPAGFLEGSNDADDGASGPASGVKGAMRQGKNGQARCKKQEKPDNHQRPFENMALGYNHLFEYFDVVQAFSGPDGTPWSGDHRRW